MSVLKKIFNFILFLILSFSFFSYTSAFSDGTLDTSFDPGAGVPSPPSDIFSLIIQPDNKSVIGGNIAAYNGTTVNHIARINTDGTLDTTFNNGGTGFSGGNTRTITRQSDGKIIVSGSFSTYNGVTRNDLIRLNTDGTLDATYTSTTGSNTSLSSHAVQSDGKIIAAGNFSTYGGASRRGIARANINGTNDTTFNPGTGVNTGANISTVVIQSDGKIIVGGNFTSYNGTPRNRIARINTDGTLDTSFDPGAGLDTNPQIVLLQSDGKIIAVGGFTTYNSISRPGIARINTDGTLDTSFTPGTGAAGAINNAVVQSDGKIIIGGTFSAYNGTARNRIARVNADGTLDTSFDPGTGITGGGSNLLRGLGLQSDDNLLIGGIFTAYNGVSRASIARLTFASNTPPTDITLSVNTVNENVVTPFTVGTLSTTDSNAGNTHTYTLSCTVSGSDDASFTIANTNELRITTAVDFETKTSYSICIRTTDQGSLSFDKNFTITVNDLDEVVPSTPVAAPDLQALSDTGSSASDNITHDTTASFDVVCTEVGSTITLYVDLVARGTVSCVGVGTTTATISPALSNGTYSITYTETDTASNQSGQSPSLSIVLDTTAPTITVTSVGGDTSVPYTITDNTPDVVLVTTVGDTVTMPDFTCTPTPAIGTSVTCTKNTPYVDGLYTESIDIVDVAGNSVSDTVEFTMSTPLIIYTLTYTAGVGGTITGISPQSITSGDDGTEVIATPNTGYTFSGWSDGVLTASRTDLNITNNITVSATFALVPISVVSQSPSSTTGVIPNFIFGQSTLNIPISMSSSGTTFVSPLDGTLKQCNGFTQYLKVNSFTNPVSEVRLWQAFLNKYQDEKIPLTGYFGPLTFASIKRFQEKYKDEILTPWGLTKPTGYTYKTTRAKANSLLGCAEGAVTLENGTTVNIK